MSGEKKAELTVQLLILLDVLRLLYTILMYFVVISNYWCAGSTKDYAKSYNYGQHAGLRLGFVVDAYLRGSGTACRFK